MDVLHPSSFVETGTCSGPQRGRAQPSRETPGVLLSDKYIVEFDENGNPTSSVDFNIPFRNAIRYTKQLQKSFDKLTPDQKNIIMNQYQLSLANPSDSQIQTSAPATVHNMLENIASNPNGNQQMASYLVSTNGGILAIIVVVIVILLVLMFIAGRYARH